MLAAGVGQEGGQAAAMGSLAGAKEKVSCLDVDGDGAWPVF